LLRFYVTHDAGRSWAPATSAAAADFADGAVSLAGGVVWAVGTGNCVGSRCRLILMRGPVSGDRLPATAAQPSLPSNQSGATISATSATTAYVASPGAHGTSIYATHDGGRHWRHLADRCAGGSTEFGLTATTLASLWRVCIRSKRFSVLRSTDGGAASSRRPLTFIPLYTFQPVSSRVAWSQDVHGTIYRTADGGAHWQPVWHSDGGAHGRSFPGFSPILSAQSGDDAWLLIELPHGPTSQGTTDGGRSWQPHAVKLPRG
jgi:photosystem II stability/assembly factor-like uncharacterized protein